MRYDVERLRNDADCREIASMIGMRRSGTYCECVSGIHKETQLNHCAIYKDHIHCFSCGDNRDVVGMVQGYYTNVLGSPITFAESCKIIGDALGGASFYEVSGTDAPAMPMLPFTTEELAAAGMQDSIGRLQALYASDRDLFLQVVAEQVKEQSEKLTLLSQSLGKSPLEAKLQAEADRRLGILAGMQKKAGGGEAHVRRLFKL